MTSMSVRMVVLSGPETPTLGRFAIRALAPAAGIAMSAGRLPKQRPSVDPNEDAAFVAVGPSGALAAVIDGHLGFDVAGAVLEVLKAETDLALAREIYDVEAVLNGLVSAAKSASELTLAHLPSERAHSGAALSLALYSGGRLAVCTIGDTIALLATPKGKVRPFGRGSRFLRDLRGRARMEVVKAPAAARLVLASDGLVDFTSQGLVTSLIASTMEHEPREAAYALMDAALLGGAGDNVTVLCLDLAKVAEASAEPAGG